MAHKVWTRQMLRLLFLILHPIRSYKYLRSSSKDYSKISLTELQSYLDSPKTIIEAGAADGIDTFIFASNFPSATVFAIEPVKQQYEHLLLKSKQASNIQLFNFALSDKNGEGSIFVGNGVGALGGMGSSSLLKPYRHEEFFPEIKFEFEQSITTLTLEKFISDAQIDEVDLLWLDIQGAELAVLNASQEILMRKVKFLHLEISRVKLYEDMPNERAIRKFLRDAGFKCVIDRVGAISGNALYSNTQLNN
jgi:FkbM family methyltransferase